MKKKRSYLWIISFGPIVVTFSLALLFIICIGQGIIAGLRDFFDYQAKPDYKKVAVLLAGALIQIGIVVCLL